MFLPDASKVQVEILGEGQQFVCDGLHPDTGQPYRWTDGSPADVAITDLPVVDEPMLREMLEEVERLFREAGAVEKGEAAGHRDGWLAEAAAGAAGGRIQLLPQRQLGGVG